MSLHSSPLRVAVNVGVACDSVVEAFCTVRQARNNTLLQVTAILVQCGLPRLLTGSIIAHEVMHAWMRYQHVQELSMDVEEGLCQLMAFLWLDSQKQSANKVSPHVQKSLRMPAYLDAYAEKGAYCTAAGCFHIRPSMKQGWLDL